jgi:hypothetical protein
MSQRFRFRPRYRAMAIAAIGLGAAMLVLGLVRGGPPLLWSTGGVGIILGTVYLLSPTWRLAVVVDDDALTLVATGDAQPRFRVAWNDVVKVVASPSTRTCFVDGGEPQRSLLVPGDGAPAPYDIEDRGALYDQIVARVARDRIVEVDLLERHR